MYESTFDIGEEVTCYTPSGVAVSNAKVLRAWRDPLSRVLCKDVDDGHLFYWPERYIMPCHTSA